MSTPNIKFENSPVESLADSFVSTPGTQYPSLFAGTMNPSEVMTPQSVVDSAVLFGSSTPAPAAADADVSQSPAPEKKPVKKRKSWGQQLPEPKTNLPPRKRAKTEDEKEQRRVERVLRNRRAAQSSRERKRLEVEALEAAKQAVEQRNRDLELRLAEMEARNLMLQRELEQFTGLRTSVSSPRHSEQFSSPPPVTFSQELFGSQDVKHTTQATLDSHPVVESAVRTVNPASLSPEIRPVAEASSNASSSDMTQHPAAMLCDLQCQSDEQRPWKEAATTTAISQLLALSLWITWTSQAISNFLTPLNQIVYSLRTGSSLSPTPSILTTIIWLATTTASLTTSTSTTSSMATTTSSRSNQQPIFNLRIRLLRRLLACSPDLARPLMDATVGAMRSASEQFKLSGDWMTAAGSAREHRLGDRESSPTVETLMTLLWAIKVIDRENRLRSKTLETSNAAAELRQACGELDIMFRRRQLERTGEMEFPLSRSGGGAGIVGSISQKSLGDYWCWAFDRWDRN